MVHLFLLLLTACGDDDATMDARVDAARDARSDARDAAPDRDATPMNDADAALDGDSAIDAAEDAAEDADIDADADAEVDADAAPDGALPPSDCTFTNVRVTDSTGTASEPVMVSNGSGYGVAWGDSRDGNSEIYFALLDADGAKIGGDVRLTNDPASSEGISIVWTGSEYGIAWYDLRDGDYEIYFTRVDASGDEIGDDVRVTNDDARQWSAALAWSGTEYGVAWWDNRDGDDEIYFARLDSTGAKIGSDLRVTSAMGRSEGPSIVSNGSGYAIAFSDDRTGNDLIYVARIDALGMEVDQEVAVSTGTTGSASLASIVFDGAGYGVGWEDSRTGMQELWFARTDSTGTRIGEEVSLTRRLFSPWNLVWTGSSYAAAWSDSRDGNLEIYFLQLDRTGMRIGGDARVTDEPATSRSVSLTFDGTDFAMAWGDDRDGNTEVYFARSTCGLTCGTAICGTGEFCLEGNFGGPTRRECTDVPSGCSSVADCACVASMFCTTGLAMCSDLATNRVFCETGLD